MQCKQGHGDTYNGLGCFCRNATLFLLYPASSVVMLFVPGAVDDRAGSGEDEADTAMGVVGADVLSAAAAAVNALTSAAAASAAATEILGRRMDAIDDDRLRVGMGLVMEP